MTRGAPRTVVLISGGGTNLQALIDARDRGELPTTLCRVISNRPEAAGLERARKAGVEAAVIAHGDHPDRETYDAALAREIDACEADLVVLAGFMRILSDAFVERYSGRLINVHPSLLPAFRGLHTHRRVLDAGSRAHGCTVHFVTPELDAGPLIVQARITVSRGDTEESLVKRVQEQEHRIYPLAVRWFAEGRLRMADDRAWLDDRPLDSPVVVRPDAALPD
ncbi:MAG: phosphoribosylglycinamide formyltransferase [Aquisalimonadaceae bacterium]